MTLNLCKREGKPHVVIDASKTSESAAADATTRFVEEHGIHVLNVAGPRLSGWRQRHGFAVGVVKELIAQCRMVVNRNVLYTAVLAPDEPYTSCPVLTGP